MSKEEVSFPDGLWQFKKVGAVNVGITNKLQEECSWLNDIWGGNRTFDASGREPSSGATVTRADNQYLRSGRGMG